MRNWLLSLLRRRVDGIILIDEKLHTVEYKIENYVPWFDLGNGRN